MSGENVCEICDHRQPRKGFYDSWSCERCGSGYADARGVTLMLSEEQSEILRAAWLAKGTP